MSDSTYLVPTTFELDGLRMTIEDIDLFTNELTQQCAPICETLMRSYGGNTIKVPVITKELEELTTAIKAKAGMIKHNFAYRSGVEPLHEQADDTIEAAKAAIAQFERIGRALELMPLGVHPSDEEIEQMRTYQLQSTT